MTALIIDACLLLLVVATAVGAVWLRNLFAATILLSMYSLLMALTWTDMQSMDVAFTEAAVGAGISTVLLIAALLHTGSKEKPGGREARWAGLATVTATGAFLIWGTLDMPAVGDPQAPIHVDRVARRYIDDVQRETHVPNMVTALLADYRGYDTMFETGVIFTAGAAMIMLLRRPARATPGPAPAGAEARP